MSAWDDEYFSNGFGYHEPEPVEKRPIEQRFCVVCLRNTLITLCQFLFQRYHENCDVWVCYACKARTRNGVWITSEPSEIHTGCGYGWSVEEHGNLEDT